MATVQRRIVHKQFNSPIALYSDVNVKETLDRELKQLNNGAIGIDFDDPSTTRSGLLAKSAVLAALEEEESQKRGRKPGLKQVVWPPALESYAEHQQVQQQPPPQLEYHQQQPISQVPVQNQQVPQEFVQQSHPTEPKPMYAPISYQKPAPKVQQRPVSLISFAKPLSPLPNIQTASPHFVAAPISPSYNSPKNWAHVQAPRSPGAGINQHYTSAPIQPPFDLNAIPSSGHFGQPQNLLQTSVVAPHQPQQPQQPQQPLQQQPQPQHQQLPYQGNPLRKEAPITQRPAPVYQSQPVAATYQGGLNMRGDMKWPPSEHKQQVELENEARRRIALGPAFRPKRVNKDYREFFAKNQVSGTYSGYRVPPGTQHIDD